MDEVAVAAVDLHAVEPGGDGRRRAAELVGHTGDLVGGEGPGTGISWRPVAVNMTPLGCTAEGATGVRWCGVLSGWEIRPACISWTTMRPPSAWTASVTLRQPAMCASVWIPGASR